MNELNQVVTAEQAERLAQIAKQLDEQGEVHIQTTDVAGEENEDTVATVH